MSDPRPREEREKQSAREELEQEYAFLLRLKTSPALSPLIARLRNDLAEKIKEL